MADKSVIENIDARVKALIEDHRRLKDLCRELTARCGEFKAENRILQEQIKALNGELSRMQLAEGFAGERRNKEKAKARVNRLMREVDKCIALLSKPQ